MLLHLFIFVKSNYQIHCVNLWLLQNTWNGFDIYLSSRRERSVKREGWWLKIVNTRDVDPKSAHTKPTRVFKKMYQRGERNQHCFKERVIETKISVAIAYFEIGYLIFVPIKVAIHYEYLAECKIINFYSS